MTDYSTITIRSTHAQAVAYRNSFYGRQGRSDQFVADMLAERVLGLKPVGKDNSRDHLFIQAKREDALELTKRAADLGLTRNQYIKMLAFGVQAAARRVPGRWGNVTVNMTAAQKAAYKTSAYGEHGGGARLVYDLLHGKVQKIDAPRDSGETERMFISASKANRDFLLREAEKRGMSRSTWIHHQLFGKNAQASARDTP